MGLDGVELVIKAEEVFGITIEDAASSEMATVGLMYNYICNKVKGESQNGCATQKAFYALRKQIVSLLNIKRSEVMPGTLVESIFPMSTRRRTWKTLAQNTFLKLPKLRFPSWIYNFLSVALVIGYFVVCEALWRHVGGLSIIVSAMAISLLGFLLFCFLRIVAFPLYVYLPNTCITLGDLSKEVLVLNTEHFKPFSEKDIWVILVNLISEQLGIEKDRIKPESHFIRDLGLD